MFGQLTAFLLQFADLGAFPFDHIGGRFIGEPWVAQEPFDALRLLINRFDLFLQPFALGIQIDHALVSPEVQVQRFSRGPGNGSDHRPIVIDVIIPKQSGLLAYK